MKKYFRHARVASIILSAILLLGPLGIWAQDTASTNYEHEPLITAAKEIMETARYCALITLDNSGHPQVRTMDPFLPTEEMVVWLGTNINSRKVGEIRNDSRVSLYYQATDGTGYVVIHGMAYLIDDPEKKEKYWKEEWERFYPDKNSTYTLIQVIPEKLEILDYKNGITSKSNTWTVPHVEFEP